MKSAREWAEAIRERHAEEAIFDDLPDAKILSQMIEKIQADAQSPRPPLAEYQFTDSEIKKIEELHAATTQREWRWNGVAYVWALEEAGLEDVCIATTFPDFHQKGQPPLEVKKANAQWIAVSHSVVPSLIHDLTQAKALLEDAQEDGMTDRLAARLDSEYQRGFEEGMGVSQKRMMAKIQDYIRPPLAGLGIDVEPSTQEVIDIFQAYDEDFPDDLDDTLSHQATSTPKPASPAGPAFAPPVGPIDSL